MSPVCSTSGLPSVLTRELDGVSGDVQPDPHGDSAFDRDLAGVSRRDGDLAAVRRDVELQVRPCRQRSFEGEALRERRGGAQEQRRSRGERGGAFAEVHGSV